MKEENFPAYMDAFICSLRKLRCERDISAREMSVALGQNVNYINLIENGKRLPSMQGFFSICEYLSVKPCDFLKLNDTKISERDVLIQKIIRDLNSLDYGEIQTVQKMVHSLV